MHVEVIDTLQRFAAVKADWEAVYEADPEAQFFLSWDFMREWLPRLAAPWFILALKPSSTAERYIAFFPLRLRTKERKDGSFYNEINMAGNYVADYTGFISHPEFEEGASRALGQYVAQLHWSALNLHNFRASDDRLRWFLSSFPEKRFSTRATELINQTDNVNNSICPFVTLPSSFDSYLSDSLSANTRQKVRRFLRQVEGSDEFRITVADAETVERDVKALLRFWITKWSARKGNRTSTLAQSNFATLMASFRTGSLFLPVLWKRDTPVGALASFVDLRKKSLLFYLAGRDETFDGPPPGLVLHAYSIRHAISNGITTYDFLRGNESYKYSFGTQERRIHYLRVSTRTGRNIGDQLDPRSVPTVLQRAIKLHETGKLTEAEQGYRQVVDVAPKNAQALYCFAQLMTAKGNHAAARRLYKTLVTIKPQSGKIWLRLAEALEAGHRFSEAAKAYREVIERQPGVAAAHSSLGRMLLKLHRHAEAVAAFEAALALQPSDHRAQSGLADALAALGQGHLSPHAPLNGIHNGKVADKPGPSTSWVH